ncbi:uncharacterized protein [Macrobrachium rosenbergii]|uniref:uncharacterized protein n=1 Tax=Macrobrachium rosenbergii TaxID=79674 RepID=UPI0034D621B2
MTLKTFFTLNELLSLLTVVLARVSLDFSNVTSPEHIRALEDFTIYAFLSHPSTSTFTLKLNSRAMQGMSHLVDQHGKLPANVTGPEENIFVKTQPEEPKVIPALTEEQIRARVPNVSEEAMEILRVIFSGEFAGPLTLVPSDDDFDDAIKIMYALRTGWDPNHIDPDPKVVPIDKWKFSAELEEYFLQLTKDEDISGRQFYSPASPLHVAPEHLKHMMATSFTLPRNHDSSGIHKLSVALYLTKKFDSFGLMVVDHVFSAVEYFFWFDQDLQGVNVIGVLAGSNWGTPRDKPIIIGAHFDTVPDTPGLDDNGSGLAALVEAARVLTSSGCSFAHSIFFVAFDLEEVGTQGSLMFVKDYLVRSIIKEFGIEEVTGAFILDCISNWDPNPNSQDFPDPWAAYLPGVNESMARHNYTGDFTAVLYRTGVDTHLAKALNRYYRGLGHNKYRLELMGLEELGSSVPNISVLREHFDFIRSDHVRFWYLNDTSYEKSIPAVLVTDMGPYRGYMRECYHKFCDSLQEGLQDMGMVTKVTQAVVWAVAELAEGKCGPRGRLSIQTLFSLMGSSDRQEPGEGMTIESVQTAMEILHFLGLLPSLSAQTDP